MSKFATGERKELIEGPAGRIELVWTTPENPRPGALAVVCHPHPLHGGTMDNKVVATLVRTYRDAGITAVRFNFRGVGASEGEHDHAKGEVDDLLAVVSYAVSQVDARQLWLAGFSFGSYVAAAGAMRLGSGQPRVGLLTLVAPPVHHYPFSACTFAVPVVVVQGDEDEVVPAAEVFQWLETLTPRPDLLRFEGCGHFFHGRLTDLKERLSPFIR